MGIKCFLIEATPKAQRYLRRYNGTLKCPGPMSYHNYKVPLDVVEEQLSEDRTHWKEIEGPEPPHVAPPWPGHCPCGYVFQDTDEWQIFTSHIYRRVDTGEEMTLEAAPVGAMWNASWMNEWQHGDDGMSMYCRVPNNHDWFIDGPCSNCPWQNDSAHADHKCWVRHGVPPNLTVDKNGNTCPVGGGSIQTPDWHGFLRNGELVNA